MAQQKFDTVEEFILAQKYNRLNRKAIRIQEYIERGWKVIMPGPNLFVLQTSSSTFTWTTSISGPFFMPIINTKWEKKKTD